MGSSLCRNYSIGRDLPYIEKTFQVREVRRWMVLMWGRKDEESLYVALMIIFCNIC